MNKSETRYDIPLRVKIKKEFEWKLAYSTRNYKCIGEFHCSNGNILLVVEDESAHGNLYNKDKFIIVGEWEDRKKEAEE